MILLALSKRHEKDFWITEVKTGPTNWGNEPLHKIDGLAIKKSWANPCFTAYEVKVSRGDFLRDDKWPAYLSQCHQFFFACPAGLIQPEELADDVGLIWYDPEASRLRVRRKAVFRPIEIPPQLLYYIIMSRIESDRHPFFSSAREHLEAWVEDRGNRQRLSRMVTGKIADTIRQQERQIFELQTQLKSANWEREQANDVYAKLSKLGIQTWHGDWFSDLARRLHGSIPHDVVRDIVRIQQQLDGLAKRVKLGV